MGNRREIRLVKYKDAREFIRNGDLLSFLPRCCWYRPWSYITWLIAFTNKNRICHSAMAAWWGKSLMCVQMTSSPDRIVLLSDYVNKWPGKIIVSRAIVHRGFFGKLAAERMVRITEKPYGWIRLMFLGLTHTLTGGLLWPNPNDDAGVSSFPPVCSEAYSRAMRLSGFDPVLGRPDSRTEPHHLYESKRMRPLFILV